MESKKKKPASKKDAMYKNGCLAASRLYSLKDNYRSVQIAVEDVKGYRVFEQKFHGQKIVPQEGDHVSTFVIDKLSDEKWRDNFHVLNESVLIRPSMFL